jgi:hypothetical protein
LAILDAQLMATALDLWHRARHRHAQSFAALQPAEKHACRDPRRGRKWRRLDLAREPTQWFVGHDREKRKYIRFDIIIR